MPCLARLVERRSPVRSGLGFLYSLRSCEKQTRNLNYYCGQPRWESFSQSYSTKRLLNALGADRTEDRTGRFAASRFPLQIL